MAEDIKVVLDILSFLHTDDETLETIVGMLDNEEGKLKNVYHMQNILPVVLKLLEEEMIYAGIPKKTIDQLSYEWCRVEKIDMQQIHEYWFRITEKGKKFFENMEQTK